MNQLLSEIKSNMKYRPQYDFDFLPIGLFFQAYRGLVAKASQPVTVGLALERSRGSREVRQVEILGDDYRELNLMYLERLIKSLLWIRGGYRILFSGPDYVYQHISRDYRLGGPRSIDVEFLERTYQTGFSVEQVSPEAIGQPDNLNIPIGSFGGGCRIGFDAGGSTRKVAALMDDELVFSDVRPWLPKQATSIRYLQEEISSAINLARAHLPRVDALGISTAGIVIDNSIRVSSLIREIPPSEHNQVKRLFYDIAAELGDVSLAVANDGEVTALAGALELAAGNLLGLTLGTSLGGGYVDDKNRLTDWLNELCFVPVDIHPRAIVDEWSHDRGVGVSYFSQDAITKLARQAGIDLTDYATDSLKFRHVRQLLDQADPRAEIIFRDIGIYLGYTIPFYLEFYPARTILLLGGVMTGRGGDLILEQARQVLADEFPGIAGDIRLETFSDDRLAHGLAVVAAGLPAIE